MANPQSPMDQPQSAVANLQSPMKKLLINNEWRASVSGKTMDVVNPATEEIIAAVAARLMHRTSMRR
jgi:hypothetical protein